MKILPWWEKMAGILVIRTLAVSFRNLSNKAKHFPSNVNSKAHGIQSSQYFQFNEYFQNEQQKGALMKDMRIYQEFVTPEEEQSLFQDIEPTIKRMRYEKYHWDDAIEGYRETEKLNWKESNLGVIDSIKRLAFGEHKEPLKHVHVLDLQPSGKIKPHVDSVKFCGDTIAGLSLLSDAVMRLRLNNFRDQFVDVLLKKRSLYIMTGIARYDYTHEILSINESFFFDEPVIKSRRISLICRNKP